MWYVCYFSPAAAWQIVRPGVVVVAVVAVVVVVVVVVASDSAAGEG